LRSSKIETVTRVGRFPELRSERKNRLTLAILSEVLRVSGAEIKHLKTVCKVRRFPDGGAKQVNSRAKN
jgi:hypothetical protein